MPKLAYETWNPGPKVMDVIRKANQIIEAYAAQDLDLTLRQLYYQFVSRGWLENKQQNYKRLGAIVNDARMAGLIDWERIADRTRNLKRLGHWTDPSDILRSCENAFRIDKWKNQKYRPEVWIEKDALTGVIEGVCERNDVPFFSCRGYTSQSEMWGAARRHLSYVKAGLRPVVFHLGDHDPSGIDMTRDIEDRLRTFLVTDYYREEMRPKMTEAQRKEVTNGAIWKAMGKRVGLSIFRGTEIRRLALNMDQVREYDPPPNPAKETDARFKGYQEEHGDESWELDALEPTVIVDLIQDAIDTVKDEDQWAADEKVEARHRRDLGLASRRWDDVSEYLNEN